MIKFFDELGQEIAGRWSKYHFDNQSLPDLACDVLAARRPADHVSWSTIADWLSEASVIPEQVNLEASFGQPPITVYSHPKFYIEALHWTTSTTDIHQHGFSGAFSVLHGSSLESTFAFKSRRRVNVHMLFGELSLQRIAILKTGDIRPIRSGAALVHSVFHLDFPSVTLVVRTRTDIDSRPQYSYAPPSLAIDPSYAEPQWIRRIQSLDFLRRIDSPSFEVNARKALMSSDLHATYKLLVALSEMCQTSQMATFVGIARAKHGEAADEIWASVEEALRQKVIFRARERTRTPDGRFLLALLLNLRSRSAILDAIRQRYPLADPKAELLRWSFELPPGVLGVEFDEFNRALFGQLIEGVGVDETLDRLGREFASDDISAHRSSILDQCQRLRGDSPFRYLLAAA